MNTLHAAATAVPVPPLGAQDLLAFLVQIGVLLVLAVGLGRLATRWGMPRVVGELVAGIVLGPSVLAPLAPALSAWLVPHDAARLHLLDGVGQIGVLLLVGVTGLHLDLPHLRRHLVAVTTVSVGSIALPMALGIGVGLLVPAALAPGADRTTFALFIGVALAMSALPVIAKILLDLRLMHRDVGQLMLSAATVNDLVGWLLLSVVSAMATLGLQGGRVFLSVALLLGTVAVTILLAATPAARAALRVCAPGDDRAVDAAVVVALILLCGAATHALGLEPILGALLAGILVGTTKRLDLERLAPLRTVVVGVLAPIFFASAGLRVDLTALARPEVLVAAVVMLVVAVVGKFAGVYACARLTGLDHWAAVALSAGLNARGVIEIIAAMVGLQIGVIGTEIYTVIVVIAVATSVMAPPILAAAMRHLSETPAEQERRVALAVT